MANSALVTTDGTDGIDGDDGADGLGVPPGGATGQALVKVSAADNDTTWATPAGGGGAGLSRAITQTAHGLVVGNLVRFNGTAYVKAQADSVANAEVVGIVSAVAGANDFTLASGGYVTGLSGLTAGTVYFLSPTTAGALTSTEPTAVTQVSKPLLVADTTTSGYLFIFRGVVIASAVPTPAMVKLYDNVAVAAITQWDVSGISQTYSHLKIVLQARGDAAVTETLLKLRLNNDSGANYDYGMPVLFNSASVAASAVLAAAFAILTNVPCASAPAGSAGALEFLIPNYASTVFHKTGVGTDFHKRNTALTDLNYTALGFLWRSTAAINQITLFPNAGNFIAGSRLTIYGIS